MTDQAKPDPFEALDAFKETLSGHLLQRFKRHATVAVQSADLATITEAGSAGLLAGAAVSWAAEQIAVLWALLSGDRDVQKAKAHFSQFWAEIDRLETQRGQEPGEPCSPHGNGE